MRGPAGNSDSYLEHFLSLHPKSIDLSLQRLQRLLARLDHPERRLPDVIHIAGTNGKGSTLAFARAMLEADGRRVHAFTSPHLIRFHERIRLAGELVSEAQLVDAFARCEAANAGAPITFFEITTAAALLLFAEVPADVLLLEVGLGGRYDATNVIEAPLVSVITPISMDHMAFLGNTLASIAREKAGIIKKGRPVIVAPQPQEAEAVILAEAQGLEAPVQLCGQDWTSHEEAGRLIYQDGIRLLDLPLPNLIGRHQLVNAGAAIAALAAADMLPDEAALAHGLTHADWPARLQRLEADSFPALAGAPVELLLDGAHNEGAARVLSAALAEMNEKRSAPLVLVLGMLTSKDADSFLAAFRGLANHVYTVPIPGEANSASPQDLAERARAAGFVADAMPDLDTAFAAIAGSDAPARVLITGSLYLAGQVLQKLKAP